MAKKVMEVLVCDTAGCDSTHNVTQLQEGDFCESCLEGQRYANEVELAGREMTPGQEWAEILDDRYQTWANEY
jgi:hypothetical protein